MELVRRWVLLNPEIKDGDLIQGRSFLLNKDLINSFDAFPVKTNVTVDSCHFFGGMDGLPKRHVAEFNRMVAKGLLSVEVNL